MSGTVRIRPAREADVSAIVAMLADDSLGSQREDPAESAAYMAAFSAIEADPCHELMVAESLRTVVGTLQLSFLPYLTYRGGWRAQIEAVRVASSRRGEGIGAVLVRWAVDRARERHCHLVQLATDKQRSAALRFYEGLGFESTHVGLKLHL